MKLALSTDHAGFERLRYLKKALELVGYECVDYGPKELVLDDDYPDFIRPAAYAVSAGDCTLGIILGGSGQGEAMVANRVKGVRCTVWYGPMKPLEAIDAKGTANDDEYVILRLSREHNDANMLSIAGRFVSDTEALKAVMLWLNYSFHDEERHQRRIRGIDA